MAISYFVHETSIIDPGACIGPRTKIWHWVHVSAGAKIGSDCSLGQNVYIGDKVIIGNNVKIQNNVSIYDNVTLEDYVFCGPSMVFTNVNNPRAFINRKDEYQDTLVRQGATLGANCTIVCGNQIGQYAFVGAGSVITKNVPDYALMVGVPARQIGWMSRLGCRLSLPLTGEGQAICPHTGDCYQLQGRNLELISQLAGKAIF